MLCRNIVGYVKLRGNVLLWVCLLHQIIPHWESRTWWSLKVPPLLRLCTASFPSALISAVNILLIYSDSNGQMFSVRWTMKEWRRERERRKKRLWLAQARSVHLANRFIWIFGFKRTGSKYETIKIESSLTNVSGCPCLSVFFFYI